MKKRILFGGFFLCAAAIFAPWFLHPFRGDEKDLAKDFKLIRESRGIQEYELLRNGLHVLLCENHMAPVGTVLMAYQVGTRDESEGDTGGSHMLEHMTFKGTEHYNRGLGTPLFSLLQQAGALTNATTGMDITEYYSTLPAERIALAMDIEADRMRKAFLRNVDFQVERDVVLNELEHLENSPVMALVKAVWKTAYEKHPYRNLAIGRRQDLEAMTAEKLRQFYNRYYWPDNAFLIAVGDFEKERVLSLIHEKFSAVPRSPGQKVPPAVRELRQLRARRVTVEREDKTEAVFVAHKSPGGVSEDCFLLEVLSQILSGGKTGRLYRRLVDSGLSVQAVSSVSNFRDPGLFTSVAFLTPGTSHEKVEQVLLGLYDEIKTKGVTEEELNIAKNQLKAQAAFAWDGAPAIAEGLGEAVAAGDWRLFPDRLEAIKRVKAEDIRRVAQKYLTADQMTVGYLVSKPSGAASKISPFAKIPEAPLREISRSSKKVLLEEIIQPSRKKEMPLAERAQITSVAGVKVISVKTDIRDVVTFTGSFEGGGDAYSKNPLLGGLTAAMLDLGTQRHDKFEIARLLEERGVELSFQTGPKRVLFRARLLKQDIPEVVAQISEQLRFPSFKAEEFQKIKQQFKVSLNEQMTSTEGLAAQELSRLVYSPTHANYQMPLEEQIRALEGTTVEDVRKFHESHYGPGHFVFVAVGDVEAGPLRLAIEKNFGGWGPKNLVPNFTKEVALTDPARRFIKVKGKKNLDVFWGHALPITRRDEKYYGALLASYALGGDFSSRLTDVVRDRSGLSYSIYSRLEGASEDIEGLWMVHMITTPNLLPAAEEKAFSELKSFAKEGIGAEELKRYQNTLSGLFKVGLATTQSLADQIRRSEEMELGLAYIDGFPQKIKRLTLEEVNQTIAQYFHPEKLHWVMAGDPEAKNAG